MCGINGFLDHNNFINETDFKNSSTSLGTKHCDGFGYSFIQNEHYTLGLANERLATIDLNPNAAQPLTSHCGNYSITVNGTIYNHLELRETLIKYGIIFSTLSDTEVVLESYKKWGNKAFEMFDGSYCFALLDKKNNILLIGRDDIGAKPLFFYQEKGFFAFASEIKALIHYNFIKKEVNRNALATYFRNGYFNGQETIYNNISRFPKGTLTTIDIHSGFSYNSQLVKYKLNPKIHNQQDEAKVVDKIEDFLTESILNRNVANVPVGVLLGSGYDSSTVAAILQKNQTKRIKTYTVGYTDSKCDVAPKARKIAEHLKTNHQEFYIDNEKALEIVKNLPNIFDEPIGNSSAIPVAFIAQQVHKEVKVLLGSEGGDELFGGYRTYAKILRLEAMIKKKLPMFMVKTYKTYLKATQPKLKEVFEAPNLIEKHISINACFTKAEIKKLIISNPQQSSGSNGKADSIKDLLIYDLHDYLPHNIITKNDKSCRYYGVESRDALLKTELIDYLATLDDSLFLKNGEQKYLLKKITHKYIPESLIDTPKKGFAIPLASWLKTSLKPLVDHYLAAPKLLEHHLLNYNEVQKITASFYKNSNLYNAQKVWLLLQFQMWYERWMTVK